MNNNPIKIWNFFKNIFPNMSKEVVSFREHGADSITLWFKNRDPFIFTITKTKSWELKPYIL